MSDPEQYGLAAAFEVAEPAPLQGVEAEAAHCWRWCQGWRPDLWPAYAALYPVADWVALAEAGGVIREAVAEGR